MLLNYSNKAKNLPYSIKFSDFFFDISLKRQTTLACGTLGRASTSSLCSVGAGDTQKKISLSLSLFSFHPQPLITPPVTINSLSEL